MKKTTIYRIIEKETMFLITETDNLSFAAKQDLEKNGFIVIEKESK